MIVAPETQAKPHKFISVIKIICTAQSPNYSIPWQTHEVTVATGSGAVLENGLILTAAHVIANQTYVQLQKVDDPEKESAQIHAVCHECDLALLKPTNPDFLKGIEPFQLGGIPSLRDNVYVCGFPIGGQEISITEGVVSRLEVQSYTHSRRVLFAATVDAAINSGNSGGPVLNESNKLIGIAFQALSDAENIGYIITTNIIQHFLEGIKKFGKDYLGFPDMGIHKQELTNPILRRHLKMQKHHTGVLVTKVFFDNSSFGFLQKHDILMEVAGHKVAHNGTVNFLSNIRTDFNAVVHQYHIGDIVPVSILRDGKEITLNVKLLPLKDLVPLNQYDVKPKYFLYCGLCFQPLSLDYLEHAWSQEFTRVAPTELVYYFNVGRAPTKKKGRSYCAYYGIGR